MALLRWSMVAALLMIAPRSLAQSKASPEATLKPSEEQVLFKLHQANQMEIDAGAMTQTRAQSQKIKQYGDQLMKDHEQADEMVRTFADKKHTDLSVKPAVRSESEQHEQNSQVAAMAQLRRLQGPAFDRAFLHSMVNDHQKAIQMVRGARGEVTDPELRSMLDKILPVLQQHYSLAQKLEHGLPPPTS